MSSIIRRNVSGRRRLILLQYPSERRNLTFNNEAKKQPQASHCAAPKPERPMTLTLKGKDLYYGSREIWAKLFKRFNLTAGKLLVKSIEFEQTYTPDVVKATLLLAKAETDA
jgi:hypothetical protein